MCDLGCSQEVSCKIPWFRRALPGVFMRFKSIRLICIWNELHLRSSQPPSCPTTCSSMCPPMLNMRTPSNKNKSATVLHGDWRVVPSLRVATCHSKGDSGNAASDFDHPYQRSTQNGDSVEAPDSSPCWSESCPEVALPAFATAGTRSHCHACDQKLRRRLPDCFLALSRSIWGDLGA